MSPDQDQKNKQKLIDDFLENPTTYHIDVIDKSMLPNDLKKRKVIDFTVKPPTMFVLTMVADTLLKLPPDILKSETIQVVELLKYSKQMIKIFCRMSHGKTDDYPGWYEDFIDKNCTPKELFLMFQEVTAKTQTGFFLNSFLIAEVSNPMMMTRMETGKTTSDLPDLIPTDSSEQS